MQEPVLAVRAYQKDKERAMKVKLTQCDHCGKFFDKATMKRHKAKR